MKSAVSYSHLPRPLLFLIVLGLALGPLAACTCDDDPPRPEPSNSTPHWGCERLQGKELTVRASGEQASEGAPVVFAVELGRVEAAERQLGVPFLDHDGRHQAARLMIVEGALGTAATYPLGDVHGDAAPPQVAAAKGRWVVAVADTDAAGEDYRIGELVAGASAGAEVTWLAEVVGGVDRSPAYDLAATEDAALLVWDDWDSTEGHGFISSRLVRDKAEEPQRLSAPKADVESPRVVVRDNGYWVLWTALGAPVPGDSHDNDVAADEEEDSPVLSVTRRWIQARPLDVNGKPEGEVVDVTAEDGYVVGFDVVAGHEGSLLIAYRDDHSSPGISGGSVFTANVTASGHVDLRLIADEGVGTGVPTLVFDPRPDHGAPHGWLSYSEREGGLRLVPLSPIGIPLQMEPQYPAIDDGVLLAAREGLLTVAAPSGRNVELLTLRCGFIASPPPPSSSVLEAL